MNSALSIPQSLLFLCQMSSIYFSHSSTAAAPIIPLKPSPWKSSTAGFMQASPSTQVINLTLNAAFQLSVFEQRNLGFFSFQTLQTLASRSPKNSIRANEWTPEKFPTALAMKLLCCCCSEAKGLTLIFPMETPAATPLVQLLTPWSAAVAILNPWHSCPEHSRFLSLSKDFTASNSHHQNLTLLSCANLSLN